MEMSNHKYELIDEASVMIFENKYCLLNSFVFHTRKLGSGGYSNCSTYFQIMNTNLLIFMYIESTYVSVQIS